jgi:hypothetical protein
MDFLIKMGDKFLEKVFLHKYKQKLQKKLFFVSKHSDRGPSLKGKKTKVKNQFFKKLGSKYTRN